MNEVLRAAGRRALGGGIPGAMAMGVQVTSMMWLRTTMNYQYRHGTTTREALRHLYNEGGLRRFYRGYGPALFQGPLSRFGDTAANAGMLALLNSRTETKDLNVGVKTFMASSAAASWRIFLMPIDATKTILQVEGKDGFKMLRQKVATKGPFVLYHGSLAAASATLVGHFPWFMTFNFLDEKLPQPDNTLQKFLRRAAMGFAASVVSDTSSNSVRVVKTYKQTHTTGVTYPNAIKDIIAKDGLVGLFGRGLKTRILANGLQGVMFSVIWKYLEDQFKKRDY